MWGSLTRPPCAPVQGCRGGTGGTTQGVWSSRAELPPGPTERESESKSVSEICPDLGEEPAADWLGFGRLFPHRLWSQTGHDHGVGTLARSHERRRTPGIFGLAIFWADEGKQKVLKLLFQGTNMNEVMLVSELQLRYLHVAHLMMQQQVTRVKFLH